MRKENESHWEAISWSPSTGFWLELVVEEASLATVSAQTSFDSV